MPVVCSNCWMVQAGPPREYAAFHITSLAPEMVSPSLVLQSGRSTRESRGIETPYADCRSAQRWNRIVVSEPPPDSPSILQPEQSRESEPITRMLIGCLGARILTLSGRLESWPATSTTLRLPLRWL